MNYKGVIIEESLEDKDVLEKVIRRGATTRNPLFAFTNVNKIDKIVIN